MNPPSIPNDIMLESLRQAVAHALELKRRLGQYAVLWRQGQPAIVESHLLPIPDTTSAIVREAPAHYASATAQD